MKIIKPVSVTPERLISSNVAEDDAPAWASVSTYSTGNRVTHQRRLYEALASIAAGVEPGKEVVTDESPAKWLDLGAVNRWKMFDDRVESQTRRTGSVAVTIRPGQAVNALSLLNLTGRSATVTLVDPLEGEVYRREESLVDAGVGNWYDWYFAPIGRRSDLALLDLPAYGTANLNISVDNATDAAEVGHVVIGSVVDIGVAEYGSSVGITDFSRKERDDIGNAVVVQRSFSKRAEFDVWLDTARVGIIQRLLASLRTQPVIWIGEETMEATILFGFYRDFDITISGPEVSDAVITIEGLV